MAEHWRLDRDDAGIAWLCLDRADASANTLASFVIRELDAVLDEFAASPPTALVMYSGKPGSFIMGADINEFGDFGSMAEVAGLAKLGQGVFLRIRRLPCPTVAAVNGVCLGGGLELAMMFDYRIGPDSDARVFGLPEVKLGLHPGFGGTVNAVRLCGVRQGMPLMLTGSPVNSRKALRIGLIDRIAGDDAWRRTHLLVAGQWLGVRCPCSGSDVVATGRSTPALLRASHGDRRVVRRPGCRGPRSAGRRQER